MQSCLGLIDAVSHGFCDRCNRLRLTSTGLLKPCLCYEQGVELRSLLRGGADKNAKKQGAKGGQGASKQGPRPGQRSSGLRQQGAGASASGAPGAAPGGEGGHRRARRRSHKAGGPQEGQGGAAGGKAE